MRRYLQCIAFLVTGISFAQVQNVTFTIVPPTFNEDTPITITASNVNPSLWGVTDIYLWAWSSNTAGANQLDSPNNGTWENSNEAQKMTNNGNGTYSISFVPTTFYNRTGIGSIGFLVKAKNGTGDKKSQDYVAQVGTIVVPPVTEAPVPAGMKDGINYNSADNSKVTLVLYAPLKQFVYVLGDFNNWETQNSYLLKKDTVKNRFWIELTGLTTRQNYGFQYLVDGKIRIADPYSTTILDEANDQFINSVTYPNLPPYPTGKTSHAVSLLRTGDAAYNWQVNNFVKPAKSDLVIYELLIRDFDVLHSFDAIKSRLDYLQSLGINAVELMPISEFDGNESWGYNPAFHMALDKYYGTPNAFKQLVDECHKRGMAVILDVVYNHATGQNPFYRMWNTDGGGYGGQASTDSPFFNPVATHSYSVFNDFNHSKQATRDYVKRTTQHWIAEYKIDGFRWDLTKGFTQNCSSTNETCTNATQADRVAVLKQYADYQWEIDPNFYVIFEHLGTNEEETQWVNYRLNEGKGIMVWSNLNGNYNEATMGYHESGKSDFSWISFIKRGWTVPANIAYMESHDEERLMYKNLTFGNASGSYSVKDLNTALKRNEMAGAFYFTVPGPKMIWQFGELGYDISINDPCRVCNKPIKWEYYNEPNRKALYDKWASMIKLKDKLTIFNTANFTLDVGASTGLKKIQLTDNSSNPEVQYITILGNFGVTTQSIVPNFQKTGTWYDLLSNKSINVTNTSAPISLQAGEYIIYGSSQVTLANEDISNAEFPVIYPNPADGSFKIGKQATQVEVYDILGRKIQEFKGNYPVNQQFDLMPLKPAVYLVRVSSDLGNSVQRLVIK
jgi:1,4-alpha-glucan branching enzyme